MEERWTSGQEEICWVGRSGRGEGEGEGEEEGEEERADRNIR